MATAIDVVKQVWEKEGIYIVIHSKSKALPRYNHPKKYNKNKTVGEFIEKRLAIYGDVAVYKGVSNEATSGAKIATVRNSYDDNDLIAIEAQFTVADAKKKIAKQRSKINEINRLHNDNINTINEKATAKLNEKDRAIKDLQFSLKSLYLNFEDEDSRIRILVNLINLFDLIGREFDEVATLSLDDIGVEKEKHSQFINKMRNLLAIGRIAPVVAKFKKEYDKSGYAKLRK
jgi:hypothetical protein